MENIALLAATYIKVTNKQFIRRGGRRCRDRMVVEFATTHAISAYHHWSCEFESRSGEVYSIQHYVMKWVLRFPPPIKLTLTI